MIISNIKTNAFKSLIDFEIEVNKDLNVFIGSNNVGKSNILKLLNLFFNPQKMEEEDFPKNLAFRMKTNNDTKDAKTFIEVIFTSINLNLKNEFSNCLIDNNNLVIRAVFEKDGTFKHYLIRNKSNSYNILKGEILPKFIYLADVQQRELNLEFLLNMIPAEKSPRSNFITYINQMLRGILEDSIMVSIEKGEESFEINVIDAYGTSNDIFNKSSGVQQLVYLAMIFAYNLDGEANRRILALEEPEMNLHAGAQKRLFDVIKSNSDLIQTFVTTHSPIFIDKTNMESVFHIGRNTTNTTIHLKVNTGDNWYSIKKDLGISINDNLFLGEVNMIVEGGTEKILIPHFIDILKGEGLIEFGNEKLNIISAESANNVKYFAEVVTQQTNLSSLVILDNDQEGNNTKNKIEKNDNLNQAARVFQFKREGFLETEIEDLVNDNILIEALENLFDTKISKQEFKEYRTNKHKKDMMVKFNKMILEINKKTKKSISKIELAAEIKKLITTSKDIEFVIDEFKLIDRYIKNLPAHRLI